MKTNQATLRKIKTILEELRQEIRQGTISYGEIVELHSLKKYIEEGDVEMLEWAGVNEFEND
jgi:hypothetical protein